MPEVFERSKCVFERFHLIEGNQELEIKEQGVEGKEQYFLFSIPCSPIF